jgi:uncharacterized protein YceH (UPF0502 family)
MQMIAPDDVEIRVVGCLVEKQRTTPGHYPLTLNSLRLACNQSTNRSPVVEYDEATIRRALGELGRRRWIRSASGHTSRAAKYRHLIDVELNLPEDQISILAVLMLRGPQTPGELKQRTERMFGFEDLAAVQSTLEDLIERDLVERLERRPGQKEERYRQLLGGGDGSVSLPATAAAAASGRLSDPATTENRADPADPSGDPDTAAGVEVAEPSVASPVDSDRVDRLEREVADLRTELAELRDSLAP